METRANYILVGLFALAVIAGGFGFVYWFNSPSSGPERKRYEVVFDGTVSGLKPGGWVLFNGLRVGEVASLRIDPDAPRQVIAVIYVDKDVVLRQDTGVGLEFQGLTGFATIALRGGSPTAPALDPPILRADLASTQDLSSAARSVLRRLDTVVSENETSVRTSLKNLEVFTGTLANNADRIERIIANAEGVVGGADAKLNDIAEAARSVRSLADNLDKNVSEVSTGLARFSNSGLREWEKLAVDGRRAILTLEQAVKNIDQNPSRLLFGGAPAQPAGGRSLRR
ncbi:MAG: MlaD family protein [Rhodoplanes sp.]|jgi:phospholipid/cholesterol/gamma-HCH transport system substrate-binding protein